MYGRDRNQPYWTNQRNREAARNKLVDHFVEPESYTKQSQQQLLTEFGLSLYECSTENSLNGAALAAIMKSLKKNTTLTKLDLSGQQHILLTFGGSKIAWIYKQKSTTENSFMVLTEEVREALTTNTTLTTLVMYSKPPFGLLVLSTLSHYVCRLS